MPDSNISDISADLLSKGTKLEIVVFLSRKQIGEDKSVSA